jgi:hypothetical protein
MNTDIKKINFPYTINISYGEIIKRIQWRESNKPKEIVSTLERCYSIVHLYARKAFFDIGINDLNPEIKPIRIELTDEFTTEKGINISIISYWTEIILNLSNCELNDSNLDEILTIGSCIPIFSNTFYCPEFLKKIFPGKNDDYYTKKTTMEKFNDIYTYIIVRDILNLMVQDKLIYNYTLVKENSNDTNRKNN